jgi:hypothetical protein
MGSLILYSTNPWFAHEFAIKFLGGKHFVWCCEQYDPNKGTSTSSYTFAPSSCPKSIYDLLEGACNSEDKHCSKINDYKKTFRKLALSYFADGSISDIQRDEILAMVSSVSWKIWRPLLYIIPREPLEKGGRLIPVPLAKRASHATEWNIKDLLSDEFEIIER